MFSSTHLPSSNARHLGSLNGKWVYYNSDTYTSYLEKTVWNGWYVVNLSGAAGNSKVWSMLVNSNGEKRSQWNKTSGGDRNNYYTINCKVGYSYRLKLQNTNYGADDIYGTWSPDHY